MNQGLPLCEDQSDRKINVMVVSPVRNMNSVTWHVQVEPLLMGQK